MKFNKMIIYPAENMNIKDEILMSYIIFTVTVTMIITGSAVDGLTLLVLLAGIWLISKEARRGLIWSKQL